MSTLKVTNIQATGETASRAVSGVAAAWVNVIYTSGTPSTIGSLNSSSLTDNSTGNYGVNFTNNFNDNNERAVSGTGCSGTGAGNSITVSHADISNTGSQGVKVAEDPATAVDQKNTMLFFGDLA